MAFASKNRFCAIHMEGESNYTSTMGKTFTPCPLADFRASSMIITIISPVEVADMEVK